MGPVGIIDFKSSGKPTPCRAELSASNLAPGDHRLWQCLMGGRLLQTQHPCGFHELSNSILAGGYRYPRPNYRLWI